MLETILLYGGWVVAAALAPALWGACTRNINYTKFFTAKMEARQEIINAQDEIITNYRDAIREHQQHSKSSIVVLNEIKDYIAKSNLNKTEKTQLILAVTSAMPEEK